jgi:hypothetical protein
MRCKASYKSNQVCGRFDSHLLPQIVNYLQAAGITGYQLATFGKASRTAFSWAVRMAAVTAPA